MENNLNLTIGDFRETLKILREIDKYKINIQKDFKIIYKMRSSIINLCLKCNWLKVDTNNKLFYIKSDRGLIISNIEEDIPAMRELLYDFVRIIKPYWANELIKGKAEAVIQLPLNIKSIFSDLNLYSKNSENSDLNAIKWWDKIALSYYDNINRNKLIIGRTGEYLTRIFEQERLKLKSTKEIKWIALESDKAGFDILSKMSIQNQNNLCIEVKTSKSKRFYFTRNEMELMKSRDNKNYQLHFWDISNLESKLIANLFCFKKKSIEKYLPINNASCYWDDCIFNSLFFKATKIKPMKYKIKQSVYKKIKTLN